MSTADTRPCLVQGYHQATQRHALRDCPITTSTIQATQQTDPRSLADRVREISHEISAELDEHDAAFGEIATQAREIQRLVSALPPDVMPATLERITHILTRIRGIAAATDKTHPGI